MVTVEIEAQRLALQGGSVGRLDLPQEVRAEKFVQVPAPIPLRRVLQVLRGAALEGEDPQVAIEQGDQDIRQDPDERLVARLGA